MYEYCIDKEIPVSEYDDTCIRADVQSIAGKIGLKAYTLRSTWVYFNFMTRPSIEIAFGYKEPFDKIDEFCLLLNKAIPGAKACYSVNDDVEWKKP